MASTGTAAFSLTASPDAKRDTIARERNRSAATAVAFIGVALVSYLFRDRITFNSGDDVGYWLGVAGVVMMLLLLIYPLRKRVDWRFPGSAPFWFRFHMMLGMAGPLAILYHARFTWRSVNSGVAVTSMLIVVASGLIGRYLHLRVYRGYSMRHLEAGELLDEARAALSSLDADGDPGTEVHAILDGYMNRVRRSREGLLESGRLAFSIWIDSHLRSRHLAGMIRNRFAQSAASNGWNAHELARHQRDARQHLRRYLAAINDAAAYGLFDRLFALWHNLHLPLFGFLVIAARRQLRWPVERRL